MPIISLPRMLFVGRDSFGEFQEVLNDIKPKTVLIVTDKIIKDLGLVEKVTELLDSLGVKWYIFDKVEPEPSFETVEEGAKIAQELKPSLIISIGGGSVIDAAKSIWLLYEKPNYNLEELGPFEWLGLGEKAKLVSIPTTSGTGSEVTFAVVLTKKEEKKKIAVGNYELVPYYSVVDPMFSSTMPKKLTASTGIDALTHAIEAYVSINANPFTDALAEKALELIFAWLPRAYRDGSNIDAREKMHTAATLAGMAFSNSGLGLAHALGHSFGPIFGIPHGFSVGVFLPYVILFNSKDEEVKRKYAMLGKVIGVSGSNIDLLFEGFVSKLVELYKSVEAPLTVKELGVKKEDYLRELDVLINNAYEDPDVAFNPVMTSPEDLEKIFKRAYEGGLNGPL